jgi:hypothetical protein
MDQSQPKSPREPNRVIGYMASLLLHSPEYAARISIIPRNHDANGQRNRCSEFHAEPNEIGGLMLTTLGAGFGYWPTASGRKKASAAAAMIGAVLLGVMADSRSPFVAIAISCTVCVVWKYRVRGAIGIAALFAIVYTAAFAIPSMRDYVNRRDVASFTGRQVAWDFANRRSRRVLSWVTATRWRVNTS